MKIVKEKEMHVEFIKLNFIELIYLRKIIIRIIFFRSMYVVAYLTMNISINNVKIKILFNNDIEVNCMSKKLIDVTYTARNESNFFITRSYYYDRFSLVESSFSFLKINFKMNYK